MQVDCVRDLSEELDSLTLVIIGVSNFLIESSFITPTFVGSKLKLVIFFASYKLSSKVELFSYSFK